MPTILLVIVTIAFNIAGQFLLKAGVNASASNLNPVSAEGIFRTIFSPLVFSGLVCYGLGAIVWIMVLSKMDLSTAYPVVLSASLVFVAFVSWIALNEPMNAFKIAGIVVICGGIYLISRGA